MSKGLSIVTAGAFALASVSINGEAQARCYGCGIGLGILGGLILGGAIRNAAPPAYYPPPYRYYPPRVSAPPRVNYAPPAASPAVTLDCDAATVDGNDTDLNPVVTTYVAHSSAGQWMVRHKLKDGTIIDRAAQYNITDHTSNEVVEWQGNLNRNANIRMIGEVMRLKSTGQPTYNEWLYKGGQLMMHSTALCRLDAPAATPVNPVTAPITTPPITAARGEDSVGILNLGDKAIVQVTLGSVPVAMQIDTGANIMSITNDVAKELFAHGEAEWTTDGSFTQANGDEVKEKRVIIHSMKIGTHVLRNILAGITASDTMLLPFQVLNQTGRFTIDTVNNKLIFGG